MNIFLPLLLQVRVHVYESADHLPRRPILGRSSGERLIFERGASGGGDRAMAHPRRAQRRHGGRETAVRRVTTPLADPWWARAQALTHLGPPLACGLLPSSAEQ